MPPLVASNRSGGGAFFSSRCRADPSHSGVRVGSKLKSGSRVAGQYESGGICHQRKVVTEIVTKEDSRIFTFVFSPLGLHIYPEVLYIHRIFTLRVFPQLLAAI